MPAAAPARPTWFRWYVCGLLLLATTINYMDRQTLSTAAKRVKADFELTNEQYGELETWFGVAFAFGSLGFGMLADRVNVRWLYPVVLVGWSVMGIATGSVNSFFGLLACRTLLGLFESGHWPCALRTTQHLMLPRERTLGNSILQGGSSVGAIFTPLVMLVMLTDETGSWRFVFQAIGALGLGWAVLWLTALRNSDFEAPLETTAKTFETPALSKSSLIRRWIVLICVVVAINACWHIFRVWLPLFLQEGRNYGERFTFWFIIAFYVATDVGCLAAGYGTVILNRLGVSVGFARWLVFTLCALFTLIGVAVAFTPASPWLLAQLLLLGAGALGLFPCFYSLSQEITTKHQGKVTGVLGMIAWLASAPTHEYFGRMIDRYPEHAYGYGLAIAGCLPLAAALIWLLVWDWNTDRTPVKTVIETSDA